MRREGASKERIESYQLERREKGIYKKSEFTKFKRSNTNTNRLFLCRMREGFSAKFGKNPENNG